jgi:RNA polymerase sigma factor (sigma-70 family)
MRNLFERARRGDRTAQSEIDAAIRRIARMVCRRGGPGGATVDWEDVAQDASARFFSVGIHQYSGQGSAEGFLHTIVRSTVLQAVRRDARRRAREDSAVREDIAPAHNPGHALDVRKLLRQLPPECSRLLEQVYLHGIPYPEIAAELDMLESSVRVKVTRCLRRAMEIAGEKPK